MENVVNRFWKSVTSIIRKRFLYAIGEIVLIFLGITFSILFDEWRLERRMKSEEHLLFAELHGVLIQDTVELDNNIRLIGKTIFELNYVIQNINQSEYLTDSIKEALSFINISTSFLPNTVVWEKIKDFGIQNISDDDLASHMSQYYNRNDYLKVWHAAFYDFLVQYSHPYVIKEFVDFERLKYAVPFNFSSLKNDKVFINVLKTSIRRHEHTLDLYKHSKDYSKEFIKRLPL